MEPEDMKKVWIQLEALNYVLAGILVELRRELCGRTGRPLSTCGGLARVAAWVRTAGGPLPSTRPVLQAGTAVLSGLQRQ